jgi:hypothetical protein
MKFLRKILHYKFNEPFVLMLIVFGIFVFIFFLFFSHCILGPLASSGSRLTSETTNVMGS